MAAGRTRDGGIDFSVSGPFAGALGADPADNIAFRAAEALIAAAGGRPAAMRLTLTKRLPVAAGLGGGSADAAAVLRLVNRQWRLGLASDRLARIGRSLGADVPMCLVSRPLVAKGIGERIAPIAGMPRLALVLACPPASVSTAKVFSALRPGDRPALPALPTCLRRRRRPRPLAQANAKRPRRAGGRRFAEARGWRRRRLPATRSACSPGCRGPGRQPSASSRHWPPPGARPPASGRRGRDGGWRRRGRAGRSLALCRDGG